MFSSLQTLTLEWKRMARHDHLDLLSFLLTWLIHTHTHTRLTALFLGLPGWAGTRKVKQSGFC